MFMPAYPLQWPAGWKRIAPMHRAKASFGTTKASAGEYRMKTKLTIAMATERVLETMRRMGIRDRDLVITTNLLLRQDGLPRSGQAQPSDPGVAVYWLDGFDRGTPKCMAIDRYDKIEDNLAAVAATLEAMRAIERHGGAAILERAFVGFAALPGPAPADWRTYFGFSATERPTAHFLLSEYRRKRSQVHPDKGGSAEAFNELERAYATARAELGHD